MNTLDAIRARCSYRGAYRPTPVPRENLRRILEAGLAAPSGCNKQTVSLIAVDDPEILRRLNAIIDPPVGRTDTAPAMICVLTRPIIAYRDRCYAVQDYAAAIENMLLAIVELGYQSCWIEGHVTDADHLGRKMADVLGVPEEYELVCYLPVGVAAEEARCTAQKQAFESRAWFNAFGCGD
ncbi:MAG: nitroreductase family protein [Candidatus Faecivicinus sp.]